MGINNRYNFNIPDGRYKGNLTTQTQSVSGNFTGAQTDPASYRGPAVGEMWELLSVRVQQIPTVSATLDTAILITDEDGIEYTRLSMTNESPYAVADGGALSWNSGGGTVLVLPNWRLYVKWYGDPVPVGAWNWQYTAIVHQVSEPQEGPVQYIP